MCSVFLLFKIQTNYTIKWKEYVTEYSIEKKRSEFERQRGYERKNLFVIKIYGFHFVTTINQSECSVKWLWVLLTTAGYSSTVFIFFFLHSLEIHTSAFRR